MTACSDYEIYMVPNIRKNVTALPCKFTFTFLRFISNLKKRRKFIFFCQTTRGIHRPLKLLYSKNVLYMLKSQVRELIFDEL